MSDQLLDINSEDFNPMTGDTQFNPALLGLNLEDIKTASEGLKNAIYAGNVQLTAEFYQELKAMSWKKYQAVDTDGMISSVRLPEYAEENMAGKLSGLYLNNKYIGFWNGHEWKTFLSNDGSFSFIGNALNKIEWNAETGILEVRGKIDADDIISGTLTGRTIRTSITDRLLRLDDNGLIMQDDNEIVRLKLGWSLTNVPMLYFFDEYGADAGEIYGYKAPIGSVIRVTSSFVVEDALSVGGDFYIHGMLRFNDPAVAGTHTPGDFIPIEVNGVTKYIQVYE